MASTVTTPIALSEQASEVDNRSVINLYAWEMCCTASKESSLRVPPKWSVKDADIANRQWKTS